MAVYRTTGFLNRSESLADDRLRTWFMNHPAKGQNQMLHRLIFFLLAVFFVASGVKAQETTSRTLDWEELKRVQAAERMQLENVQKETLRQTIEIQRESLKAVAGSTGPTQQLATEQKQERLELAKIHADERAKLAAVHAQERKDFQQAQNAMKAQKSNERE